MNSKEKYLDALFRMQKNLNLSNCDSLAEMSPWLAEISNLLGISRIEVKKEFLEDNTHGHLGPSESVIYTTDNVDYGNFHELEKIGEEFVSAAYRFYRFPGLSSFSGEELECIEYLASVIYSTAGSILLKKFLTHSKSHEQRFKNIYNQSVTIQTLKKIIGQNLNDDYGIAFFNIRQFSSVNKKFGERKATFILETFFNELNKLVNYSENPMEGMISALGGDNGFIIFKKRDREKITNSLDSMEISFETENGNREKAVISCHYGINLELEGYQTAHAIIDTVSTALNIARKTPGMKSVIYDESFKRKYEMQRKIEGWFKDALKDEEFLVYYQPKIDLHKYELHGAEALVRWVHKGIMVYPDQFIPVLEQNLSIKYLDLYMLNHVCANIAKWLSEGKTVPQISVNLSRASLEIENLVDVISSTIDKYNVPRTLVQIELTESASTSVNSELKSLVEGLSARGISTAMDDFGTGFSSLSLIKELPWDVLKIDKSLLKGAQKNGSQDQLMFKAIISMANMIGLKCIVEGVETKDDVKILKESNCYMAQGYYFSKPIPTEEFEKLLK